MRASDNRYIHLRLSGGETLVRHSPVTRHCHEAPRQLSKMVDKASARPSQYLLHPLVKRGYLVAVSEMIANAITSAFRMHIKGNLRHE